MSEQMVTVKIGRVVWDDQATYWIQLAREIESSHPDFDIWAAIEAADASPSKTTVTFTAPLSIVTDLVDLYDYVGAYEPAYVDRSLIAAGRRAAQSLVKQLRACGAGDFGHMLDRRWAV